jgi:hypothetical protein
MENKGMENATAIQLVRPIAVKGHQVSELSLRNITASDVYEIGFPMLVFDTGDSTLKAMEFRPKVVFDYIARLSGVPLATVKTMAMDDLAKCHKFVLAFFD